MYTCCFIPIAPGDIIVDVRLHGVSISGAPFLVSVVAPLDPTQSTVEGDGLEGGIVHHARPLRVTLIDTQGNRYVSAVELEATLVCASTAGGVTDSNDSASFAGRVHVEHMGEGIFNLTYSAPHAGEYELDVVTRCSTRCHDVQHHLCGMPHNVSISKGACAARTIAHGPGVERGVAHRDLPFRIIGRDENEALVTCGGDAYAVKVVGPSGEVPCELKDEGIGTFAGLYRPPESGEYEVEITLGGESIKVCHLFCTAVSVVSLCSLVCLYFCWHGKTCRVHATLAFSTTF